MPMSTKISGYRYLSLAGADPQQHDQGFFVERFPAGVWEDLRAGKADAGSNAGTGEGAGVGAG
jgi:hypothetical protein